MSAFGGKADIRSTLRRCPLLTLNGPAGDALGQKVKVLKLGDPLDETSDIGTIINEKQFSKVCGYVEEGT